MDFIFKSLGYKKPQVRHLSFRSHLGLDSSCVEAAHDTRTGYVLVNLDYPISHEDRTAVIRHETVHHQVHKLSVDRSLDKLEINGMLISKLGIDNARIIASYIDSLFPDARIPDATLANEIIPYLASISVVGSSHRMQFMSFCGITDISGFDNKWREIVEIAYAWRT